MSGKKTIRLGFAGDLMLGGEPLRYAQERGLAITYPFRALIRTLSALDVLFINLEGPLFPNPAAAMRKPLLLSNHPAVVEVLKLPRICVCSLANNHALDYGAHALVETQRCLDKHGIRYLGAGRTAAEAERGLVVERSGWRIGCLAFTTDGPGLRSIIARDGKAGCASLRDTPALLKRVRNLKKDVDVVIVLLHWGREFYEYPGAAQVRLAHALVDAGAHLIVGHHPHAIQAVEEYHGAVIAYSLGHLFMPPFRLPIDPVLHRQDLDCASPRALSLSKGVRPGRGPRRTPKRHAAVQDSAASYDGPIYYPRPASKEFVLMRVELPDQSPASVNLVAGGLDPRFRLRPYNRIGLQAFRSRLDDLAWPLGQAGYGKFWRHYHAWRQQELKVLLRGP